jgi:hypothetical protein
MLLPTEDAVRHVSEWQAEHNADAAFNGEQRDWLDRIADQIAASLSIEPEDFDIGWFGRSAESGGLTLLWGAATAAHG